MTKEEFIKRMYLAKTELISNFEFQKLVLNDLIRIGFIYVNEHFIKEENKFANMMLQMSLLKAKSLIQLSEGNMLDEMQNIEEAYIDTYSQASIFRSLYENYCFFNHLYIQNWLSEEFLILENIWKISSLKQRHELINKNSFVKGSENDLKINKEQEFILKLTKEIKETSIYGRNKKFIDNAIKRNKWQVTIIDSKMSNISWKDMFRNSMKNQGRGNRTYQMYSLDAHPSYFSVFQFGELYKNRHDLERRTTLLFQTIELICNYLNDFETLIKSEIEIDIDSKYLIEILGKNQE